MPPFRRQWPVHVFLIVGCMALMLSSCRKEVPEEEQVLATVNGIEITVHRFNVTYAEHLIRTGKDDTIEEREMHLGNLIDTFLFAEEARRRGMESDEYRAFGELALRHNVAGSFYHTAFLDTLSDVTEEHLRRVYMHERAEVVLRHLLYYTEADARAAYARLQAGEDFVMLANECFGTETFHPDAGMLGVAGYWQIAGQIAELAFEIPVGSYTEPVRTRYGWHIVRVEHRVDDPLVTEAQFETNRRQVHQRARERRMNLEGERFIRSYMENAAVEIDEAAMAALERAVRIAIRDEEPMQMVHPDGAEIEMPLPRRLVQQDEMWLLVEELGANTVLATFTAGGSKVSFTAEDFARWMPVLARSEIRSRPGVAVGRALRNELMAREGAAAGLEKDPWVREEVRYVKAQFLEDALRRHIRQNEPVVPTDEEIQAALEHLGGSRMASATGTYWAINFDNAPDAMAAQQAIVNGGRTPSSFSGFQRTKDADLLAGDAQLNAQLRRSSLNNVHLAGTADESWYVFSIEAREIVQADPESVRSAVIGQITPHLAEARLRLRLRASAKINVDRELFESIMPRRTLPVQN
jgi:hypothetical protein